MDESDPDRAFHEEKLRMTVTQKKYCQNPNPDSTKPKPKITLVGLDTKMTLQTTPPHPTHPPPTETQCQQCLSGY